MVSFTTIYRWIRKGANGECVSIYVKSWQNESKKIVKNQEKNFGVFDFSVNKLL